MWLYILQGIGYGVAAAAQAGPLQTYLVSQALTKGWKRTLPAALAPLISDGPIVAVSLLILSQVPSWLQRFLHVAGGLYILYLAYGTYRAWKNLDPEVPHMEVEIRQSVFKAALINTLNPNPYLFWSLVTGPVFLEGWRESPILGMSFVGGFYLSMILSLCAIIFAFGAARGLGPRVNRALLGMSAVALLGFGLFQLWLGLARR